VRSLNFGRVTKPIMIRDVRHAAAPVNAAAIAAPPTREDDEGERFCQFHIGDEDEAPRRDTRESSVDSTALADDAVNLSASSGEGSLRPKFLPLSSETPLGRYVSLKQHMRQRQVPDDIDRDDPPAFFPIPFDPAAPSSSLPASNLHKRLLQQEDRNNGPLGATPPPRIRCNHHISAPPTPSIAPFGPWSNTYRDPGSPTGTGSIVSIDEEGRDAALLSPDDAMSVCSVDGGGASSRKNSAGGYKGRSKSRLSLNFGHDDRSPSPTSVGRGGGSLIPKFLRASFSKLMSGSRDRKTSECNEAKSADNNNQGKYIPKSASSLAFIGRYPAAPHHLNVSPLDVAVSPEVSEVAGVVPESPSVMQYVEQAKKAGLPVIPFAFPTAVVAEKLKEKREKQKNASGDSEASNRSEPMEIRQRSARSRRYLEDEEEDIYDGSLKPGKEEFGPKSLENLVTQAQQELRMESGCEVYDDEDVDLMSLGPVKSAPKQLDQQGRLRRRRLHAREPSTEEGYVPMKPNVSRNPSRNPSPASNSDGSPPPVQAFTKCMLAGNSPQEEEHFEMDFSKN